MDELFTGHADVERVFRSAMRITAANMSLLTCRATDGRRHGTATSTAVALTTNPPRMIVADNQSERTSDAIIDTGLFCINLLAQEHLHLVDGSSHGSRLAGREWSVGYGDLPYLNSALASVFCDLTASHVHGSHVVFFGVVRCVACDPADERIPLIWLHGGPLAAPGRVDV